MASFWIAGFPSFSVFFASATSASKVASAFCASPIMLRSCFSVVRDTSQPSPRLPTIQSLGVRASLKNTSLKSAAPVIWRSGRTSMPGCFIDRSRYEMPPCFCASGSVRHRQNM